MHLSLQLDSLDTTRCFGMFTGNDYKTTNNFKLL